MTKDEVDGIGLAEAIIQIKEAFSLAQGHRVAGGLQLPVKSVTVELKVVAAKKADGKAGFKVPLVDVEVGGGGSRTKERTQTITVVFDGPLDEGGSPQRVAAATNTPDM